ncbi:hypothetical protein WJM97_21110 [Okeanomitos corallinicola TIOX110]|uniref:Lipoprotein n=1 Tax=Okeanomitos corallinicola TIOX110 TaxID=3133117 RepID=A0ABZ2UTY8_9CYAN
MNIQFIKLISVVTLLISVTACNSESQQKATSDNRVITEDKTVVIDSKSSQKPPSKTATILVEGEKNSIDLKLYEDKNLFSTYFPPEDFVVATETSAQQKEVKFIVNFGGVKNEDAYLKIVFPEQLQNIEAVKNFINGENGLIASNKWKIVNRNNKLTYPWVKEKIAFSKGKDIVGDIYIGAEKGKVFYVITHLPIEYVDGFSAREDLIFRNLEIGG